MLTLLITAFVLGLVFNATPGPVFAETVRQGVRGGFRSALAVQLGSLVGDALWAVVGLIGVGLLLRLESLRMPTGIASVIYLSWLAWNAWQASRGEVAVNVEVPPRAPTKMSLRVPLPPGWKVTAATLGGNPLTLGANSSLDLTGHTGQLSLRLKVEAAKP